MKILRDKTTHVIIDIVPTAEIVSNGIDVGKCIYGTRNIEIIDIDTIPEGIKAQKHKYVDGEFIINEDYKEPIDEQKTLKDQQEKIKELEALVADLSEIVLEV